MKVNVIHRDPDVVRIEKTAYYEDMIKHLEEFDKSIECVSVLELPGLLEMRVIFSENAHEKCYKSMKKLIEKSKATASKYELNLNFIPLKCYDDCRLQFGPVLQVGDITCVFKPPENGEFCIFRPRDHEKLLKKYGLPTKETTISQYA